MTNSADPDQLASLRSQLIWIYTVCKGETYPGSAGQTYPGSAGQGLRLFIMVFSSPSFLYTELGSSHLCQYNVTGVSITYMLLGYDTEVRRHYKWASVSTVTSRHRHGIYERFFEGDLKTQFK